MITVENLTTTSSKLDHAIGERGEAARQYVEQLRAFYVHAAVFAAVMVVIYTVNLLTNLDAGIAGEGSAWWSVWAQHGWVDGIAFHGLGVRLTRPSFSTSSWVQRQLE